MTSRVKQLDKHDKLSINLTERPVDKDELERVFLGDVVPNHPEDIVAVQEILALFFRRERNIIDFFEFLYIQARRPWKIPDVLTFHRQEDILLRHHLERLSEGDALLPLLKHRDDSHEFSDALHRLREKHILDCSSRDTQQ